MAQSVCCTLHTHTCGQLSGVPSAGSRCFASRYSAITPESTIHFPVSRSFMTGTVPAARVGWGACGGEDEEAQWYRDSYMLPAC
jgi:hypothetical protein